MRPDGSRPGLLAIPAGVTSPRETSAEAALRVLQEALGLNTHPSQIMGELDDVVSSADEVITPFVAWFGGLTPPSPRPQACTHAVTADELLSAPGESPGGCKHGWRLQSCEIDAPSAAILRQFRDSVLLQPGAGLAGDDLAWPAVA
ncbi:UNVERIFIED_ORG: ADP-ribose pyrophosphatase YjhB (NUDIX family) [Arthrobacter sp. UYEF10]